MKIRKATKKDLKKVLDISFESLMYQERFSKAEPEKHRAEFEKYGGTTDYAKRQEKIKELEQKWDLNKHPLIWWLKHEKSK